MAVDDAAMDRAHEKYLHARSNAARIAAMTELVRVSEPFISRVLRHFAKGRIRDLEPEDALQEARFGFVDAVHRCDPTKGPLRPFAMSRIRHHLQTLTESSATIKIPRRSGLPAAVLQRIEAIRTKEGREPTREELGEHWAEYEASDLRPRVTHSLDRTDHTTTGGTIHDRTPSESLNPHEELSARESSDREARMSAALGALLVNRSPERLPRKRAMTTHSTESTETTVSFHDPMSALRAAIAGVQTHIKAKREEEDRVRREREAAEQELAKQLGSLGIAAPTGKPVASVSPLRPVLAIGQDKITHRICRFLRENPNSRISQIAAGIGEPTEAVGVALTQLREAKQVRSEGKARGTSYRLASSRAA